jgi:hypothetical protein
MIVDAAKKRSGAPVGGALLGKPAVAPSRARPKPSPRNMQIYELVHVQNERQEQVAARFGINQQRVSQICSQVEAWRRWLESAPDFEVRAADERRRMLLAARLREERLLLLALQRALEPAETLVTERTMTSSEGTKVDRYEKLLPANPAWLKFAAQSARRITRLGERLGVDVEASDVTEQIDELLNQIAASSAELNEGASSSTTSNDHGESVPEKDLPEEATSDEPAWQQRLPSRAGRLSEPGAPSRFLSRAGTSESRGQRT